MEPTNNGHYILLSGKGLQDAKGYIVTIDFAALFTRYCKGYIFAGSEDSDYSVFRPAGYQSSKCWLL